MRILIYGAGVIGCLYGALFSEAGYDVTILARGRRLESLAENGLRYKSGSVVKTAKVNVIGELADTDRYDFVFVTVRENQLYEVLKALKSNISPNIVTMVNSLDTYDKWEEICGRGRIIPAFPGAGGGFDGDVLDAAHYSAHNIRRDKRHPHRTHKTACGNIPTFAYPVSDSNRYARLAAVSSCNGRAYRGRVLRNRCPRKGGLRYASYGKDRKAYQA